MAKIHIIAGSKSDSAIVEKAEAVLRDEKADYAVDYCSFHREPKRLHEILESSDADVFICIAGLSAALHRQVAPRPV